MTKGLGPDGYRAALVTFCQEQITASGKTLDVRAAVGQLLFEHGFDGLFDPNDKMRMDVVITSLAKLMPPDEIETSQGKSNWYGFGSESTFMALDPMERMKLEDRYQFEKANAEAATKQAQAAQVAQPMKPHDFETWRPERKLEWQHAHDAKMAKAKA